MNVPVAYACVSAGLLGVAFPDPASDATVWAQWGLAGMVVGFTLWRDYYREKGMARAKETSEQWIRDTMLGAIERNTAAMHDIIGGRRGAS